MTTRLLQGYGEITISGVFSAEKATGMKRGHMSQARAGETDNAGN